MYLSKLVGERIKQTPNGAVVKIHILLLRAGYIKQVSSGIYTLLTPAKKSILKISLPSNTTARYTAKRMESRT